MSFVATRLDRQVGLGTEVLDTLMPMHLVVDADGRCVKAGPTLIKMLGREVTPGDDIFDILEFRRPVAATTMAELADLSGARLTLALRAKPLFQLRGVLGFLPDRGSMILNLSLGLSFAKAVAAFDLTLSDFSPCDQTIELLYLHEANSSTAKLSRHLTERLDAARATAEARALTDALTGLGNRRAMDLDLARTLEDPTENIALLHVDLDLFKQVNDTHGHAAGDLMLGHVGEILRTQLRDTDTAARTGGDEFLVILRDVLGTQSARAAALRLIGSIEEPVTFEGELCRISASIGIALSADYATRPSPDQMLHDTDMALYAAKRGGRGRCEVHHPGVELMVPTRRVTDPHPITPPTKGAAGKRP